MLVKDAYWLLLNEEVWYPGLEMLTLLCFRIWRDISKNLLSFYNSTKFNLGDGQSIRFLGRQLAGPTMLSLIFLDPASMASKLNISVASQWRWRSARWCILMRGSHSLQQLDQLKELLSLLQHVTPSRPFCGHPYLETYAKWIFRRGFILQVSERGRIHLSLLQNHLEGSCSRKKLRYFFGWPLKTVFTHLNRCKGKDGG